MGPNHEKMQKVNMDFKQQAKVFQNCWNLLEEPTQKLLCRKAKSRRGFRS